MALEIWQGWYQCAAEIKTQAKDLAAQFGVKIIFRDCADRAGVGVIGVGDKELELVEPTSPRFAAMAYGAITALVDEGPSGIVDGMPKPRHFTSAREYAEKHGHELIKVQKVAKQFEKLEAGPKAPKAKAKVAPKAKAKVAAAPKATTPVVAAQDPAMVLLAIHDLLGNYITGAKLSAHNSEGVTRARRSQRARDPRTGRYISRRGR